MSELIASDGLIARDSGPWARRKLENLDRYAGMVTTAMRHKWTGGVVFVDLMAGPGVCIDTHSPGAPEFLGSTLVALGSRYPFTRIVAVESHPDCAAALAQRLAQQERADLVRLLTNNCNDPGVVATIRAATEHALTLMFVDLLGTEVHMATLRTLTTGRSVDLLITWPEMDVVRNRGQMLEQADRWTRFFGTEEWLEIAKDSGPVRRLHALQRLYVRQLRTLGYSFCRYTDSVKNSRKRALYRPLFASRDQLGLQFWETASRHVSDAPRLPFY